MTEQEAVRLFTLSTCGHCKATKKFLDDNGVEYEFADVDLLEGAEREAAIKEIKRYNPRCTFPTLIFGDRVVTGHREDEIREVLGLA